MSGTIVWNGEVLIVRADGRANGRPVVGVHSFTPEQFYRLTPDMDVHEIAARAIANRGVEMRLQTGTNNPVPRNARHYAIAQ
jgi:hypothetical protein